jgi:hypothetical protein
LEQPPPAVGTPIELSPRRPLSPVPRSHAGRRASLTAGLRRRRLVVGAGERGAQRLPRSCLARTTELLAGG